MRKVIISKRATYELEDLFDFLDYKWSVSIRKKVAQKLNNHIEKIRLDPELFPKSNIRSTRKCVISKQITLYYDFDDKNLNILRVLDTRQDPNKIKKIE
ncbi:type II toxin-antitoxin system RelE/ParE family toxin [Flavobacterium sp.]|uniref:type II toxin-antitoxin system RelE/ParE family toxin n=1 Tax=Flavobacterium sp. TaxID=239 RepID=UPI00260AAC9E|nr:type II toxin-antitoxin system RelE/ParE family toxin [Flavobacterium sp.]MDG2430918.1 type II toxin-antitoxin system RelE/ParE family toxin [Flavobacterium sp.]